MGKRLLLLCVLFQLANAGRPDPELFKESVKQRTQRYKRERRRFQTQTLHKQMKQIDIVTCDKLMDELAALRASITDDIRYCPEEDQVLLQTTRGMFDLYYALLYEYKNTMR